VCWRSGLEACSPIDFWTITQRGDMRVRANTSLFRLALERAGCDLLDNCCSATDYPTFHVGHGVQVMSLSALFLMRNIQSRDDLWLIMRLLGIEPAVRCGVFDFGGR
jgi:hypothetical protein